MRVIDLTPGDLITSGDQESMKAIFITQNRHPLYPGLQLVVWYVLEDPSGLMSGEFSFDALNPIQHVGHIDSPLGIISHQERQANLRRVFHKES